MPNKTTTAQLFVKQPQAVAEATEGTTPASSPNFSTLGCIGIPIALSIKIDGQWVDVAQIAVEDLASIIQGLNTYEVQLKFAITGTTAEINYLKRFCNSANYGTPAGTPNEPITITWSIYLNGAENFIFAKGMRPNNFTYARDVGKADEFTVDFKGTMITTPSTTSYLTTPIWATAITGTVLGHLSGGANPLVYSSGTASALDLRRFSFTVNRNVNEDYTVGLSDPHSTQPHSRRIAGDYETLWSGVAIGAQAKSMEDDSKTGAKRTLVFTLYSTTPVTITFTNAATVSYSRDISAGDTNAVGEQPGFRCPTVVIA